MIKVVLCFTLLGLSPQCSLQETENETGGICLPKAYDADYPNLPLPPLSKIF